jgi:pimeloyl-ACP methyl ester carboxylesterase
MTRGVLVHGAFRGAWSWVAVIKELKTANVDVVAVDLTGMGEGPQPRPSHEVHMADWISDVIRATGDCSDVLLVGHSMGGIVVTAASSLLRSDAENPVNTGNPENPGNTENTEKTVRRIRTLLIDAPLITNGLRAVDVSSAGPVDESKLPPASTWIPPRNVGPEDGFSEKLATWVNQRLCDTPFAPSLDEVTAPFAPEPTLVFCELTPPFFPSAIARAQCDETGRRYELLACHHDAPLLQPMLVVELVLGAMRT